MLNNCKSHHTTLRASKQKSILLTQRKAFTGWTKLPHMQILEIKWKNSTSRFTWFCFRRYNRTKPTQLLNWVQWRCSGLEDQFGILLLKRSLLKPGEKCLCNTVQLHKDIQDWSFKRFIKLDHREVYNFWALDSFNLALLSSDSDAQFFFRADRGVWFHKPN